MAREGLPQRRADERRRWLRVPVTQPVGIITARGASTAHCRDIGGGGMALYTPNPPSVGSLVNVVIELPNTAEVNAVSVVVRSGAVVGLRFIELQPHDLTAINSFIFKNVHLCEADNG